MRPVLLASLLAAAAIGTANVPTEPVAIGPGSPAPALSVKKWFKGEPVTDLSKGIHVVEFWATWCGPCRSTIPHLTELAKQNSDVKFLGVSIWEDDTEKIPAFVAEMGEKMGYAVGYSGNQDGMAATWMTPAAQNGIPSAFIVKDGVIQWIGHPMTMDKPLAAIRSGTYDLAAFKAEFDKEADATRKSMAVQTEVAEITKLYTDGKKDEAKAWLTDLESREPSAKSSADALRYRWLAAEDVKAWEKATDEKLASGEEGRSQVLSFALRRARTPADRPLGEKAIEKALAATKREDFVTLNYAAAFYSSADQPKKALDAVKRMIKLLPTTKYKDDAGFRARLEKQKADLEVAVKTGRG